MALLRGRSGGGRTSRLLVVLLFVLLNGIASLQFSAAAGENPVIFQFGKLEQHGDIHDWNAIVQAPRGFGGFSQINSTNITCSYTNVSSPAGYIHSQPFSPAGDTLNQFEDAQAEIGSCLYDKPVQLAQSTSGNAPSTTSFSTIFQASIYPSGSSQLSFFITNDTSNSRDPRFAINFRFDDEMEFSAHVDLSVNGVMQSQTGSVYLGPRGYLNASNLDVWIQYDAPVLQVYNSSRGDFAKPRKPLIRTEVDLTEALLQGDMYIGFSVSMPSEAQPVSNRHIRHYLSITGWTFNLDGPAPDFPRLSDGTLGDPIAEAARAAEKRKKEIILITAVTIPSVLVFVLLVLTIFVLYKRNARLTALAKKYEIEDELLDQGGPQSFTYKVLSAATKGFSSHALLGSGGFGSVYRGKLWLKGAKTPTEIAVKRISATSHQGAREFLAEVKIIGQVQHRNLVRLLGWCHEKGELMLVYEYMPNGSVDQHLFKDTDDSGSVVLTWSRRLKIVSGVASALAYLHEDWEQRVIHRDVKSSNVMLDSDFNARLGDFGLARLSAHDQAPPSTAILAGTYGYLAPEMAHTLKATEKTDVYSFGAMVLEVATGKRPILSYQDQQASNCVLLVDWVWSLYRNDNLVEAADSKLQAAFDLGEMITFLKIGLLCSHPDPNERPNMREVVSIWKGSTRFPFLPRTKPVPTFAAYAAGFDIEEALHTDDYGQPEESSDRAALIRSSKDHNSSVPPPHAGHGRIRSWSMPPLRHMHPTSLIM